MDKQTLETVVDVGVLAFGVIGVATLTYYKAGFDLYKGKDNIFTRILYKVSVKDKENNSFNDFVNNYRGEKNFLNFLLNNKP